MRTTIDLPDPLFREVKATAASRGLKIKDFIAHSLSHWDSTILAAARASGCQILYSEDLHDGFSLGSLSVVNPFRHL